MYQPVYTIYELAKILKRDTKNVSDDVHYLAAYYTKTIQSGKKGVSRKCVTP